MKIYNGQRSSSKRRKHPMPTYSLDELREYMFASKRFHILYDNWKNTGYQKAKRPSIDRKDDDKPYTMSNIRITTWERNRAKQAKDIKSGKLKTRHIEVSQYSKDNKLIATFDSLMEASRQTGISRSNIGSVLKGKRKTAGGFLWI